jgi:hypothetical protein
MQVRRAGTWRRLASRAGHFADDCRVYHHKAAYAAVRNDAAAMRRNSATSAAHLASTISALTRYVIRSV